MQFKPITAIVVLLIVVASLLVAGCINNSSNTPSTSPASQVKQYADAWHESIQNGLGPNETLTTWKERENGTDAIRLQWTVVNSTSSGLTTNGTTTSYSVNVKQFTSSASATDFYDDVSFGYVPATSVNATSIKPEDNIYKQVTGNNVTVVNGAWKLDSFTFVSMQAGFAVQQNEFVLWGTASVMPNSSTATTTPTPTSLVAAITSTPTATPTPSVVAPSPTPPATYQVIISGPTTIHDGQGGTWTATVLVNGVALPQSQLTNKISWFIDGHAAGGSWGPGTLTTDANGSETTWAPNGVHTLNAEYLGDPSLPNASITVTKVSP